MTEHASSHDVSKVRPDEVPDDLVDLFIATTHPGKGTVEARRIALAAFASRYADAERQKVAEERVSTAGMIREFHAAMGDPPHPFGLPSEGVRKLRLDLIQEEFHELCAAVRNEDLVATADALADITYVVYGTAYAFGIDLDAVLAEVHRSNMTKDFSGPPGDRKARKGAAYSPPDIEAALRSNP